MSNIQTEALLMSNSWQLMLTKKMGLGKQHLVGLSQRTI